MRLGHRSPPRPNARQPLFLITREVCRTTDAGHETLICISDRAPPQRTARGARPDFIKGSLSLPPLGTNAEVEGASTCLSLPPPDTSAEVEGASTLDPVEGSLSLPPPDTNAGVEGASTLDPLLISPPAKTQFLVQAGHDPFLGHVRDAQYQ